MEFKLTAAVFEVMPYKEQSPSDAIHNEMLWSLPLLPGHAAIKRRHLYRQAFSYSATVSLKIDRQEAPRL
jgi:hypothetical protein